MPSPPPISDRRVPLAEVFRDRISRGDGAVSDPAPPTFADGVASMEVLDAIRQSAREGRSVEVSA